MPNKVFELMLGISNKANRFQIQRLSEFYQMCLFKGKSGTYNDVLIDDILVDRENVEKYAKGIKGYRIVETASGYRNGNEYALIMKYPVDKDSDYHVKIIFENKKAFWRQYFKLTDPERVEPIIIAGDWEPTPDEKDFQSQCVIHRRRQIYYVNE